MPTGVMIYVDPRDRDRLAKIGKIERRGNKDQLTVILDEACEKRGLDPQTVQPIEPAQTA